MITIKIYRILATLFWFVRQFLVPNPFDALGEGIPVVLANIPIVLSPELLNWFADPIIAVLTYGVVGLYYIKRSDPELGSILYMIFYAIHIGLLYLMLSIYPIVWLMILIGGIYLGLHVTAVILIHKSNSCSVSGW